MRVPTLSKAEWGTVAAIVVLLVALLPPTPHWRETSSQSCHRCGNRRVVIRDFRWWRLDRETIEPVVGAEYDIPKGHIHDWWEYSSTYVSYNKKWAADNAARYRDGRSVWTSSATANNAQGPQSPASMPDCRDL
jgi:hypothetical protein